MSEQEADRRSADDVLHQHDDPKQTRKERGYSYGGKARTAYLPGALPSSWSKGDPTPSDADRFDRGERVPSRYRPEERPAIDGSAEYGTDGDDVAGSPLERMAVPDDAPGESTDPEQGKFRGPPWPDRRSDPYGWEMFFRGMMRAAPYALRQTPWTLAKAMIAEVSICRYCGQDFDQPDTGRAREYCSDAHRQKAYRERRMRRVTKPR